MRKNNLGSALGKHVRILSLLLVIVHVLLGTIYSSQLPWGGDEWYTWEGRSIMALPYTLMVEIAKLVLGKVSVHNYVWYRQIGLLCVLAAMAYLTWWSTRPGDVQRSRFSAVSFLYLVLSSFVLFQEQLFRYYGFYILAVFVVFGVLYSDTMQGGYSRKHAFALLALSPFLHMFIFWQIALYTIVQEIVTAVPRKRALILGAFAVAGGVTILTWKSLMKALLPLIASDMHATGAMLRGWSTSMLIKPAYAVFQFLFGMELTPTENIPVMAGFALLLVVLAFQAIGMWRKDRRMFGLLLSAGILPLLGMYWLLEALTLPGSTQFESKHAMFALPFVLLLLAWRPAGAPRWQGAFLAVPLLAVLYGTVFDFTVPRADWRAIAQAGRDCIANGGIVIVDGRADRTFRFYLDAPSFDTAIVPLQEAVASGCIVHGGKDLLLVLNDWKSYQELSVEQNWNSGFSSAEKVSALNGVLGALLAARAQCVWSQGVYPLYAYRYKLDTDEETPPKVLSPPGVMYKDLIFPLTISGKTVLGMSPIRQGDTLSLADSAGLVLFCIEGAGNLQTEIPIGEQLVGTEKTPIVLDHASGRVFADSYARSLRGTKSQYKWTKRPVVTSSLVYPGSYLSADAWLHGLEIKSNSLISFVVTVPGITMNIFQ